MNGPGWNPAVEATLRIRPAQPVEPVHVAGHEHQIVAVAREQPRQLEPDAARGPGDHSGSGGHTALALPLKADSTPRASRVCRVASSCDEYTCRTTPVLSMTYVTRPGRKPSVFAAPIREQQERQRVACGEATVRPDRVRAHADHLGALAGEPLVVVAERPRLERTAWCLVLRIEVQHDGPLSDRVPQPDRLAPLVRQREIRRDVSNAQLPLFLSHPPSPRTIVQGGS